MIPASLTAKAPRSEIAMALIDCSPRPFDVVKTSSIFGAL